MTLFLSLVLLSGAMFYSNWPVLAQLVINSPEYSHIALVLPISIALIYLARVCVFSEVRSALFVGIGIIAPAILGALFLRASLILAAPDYRITFSIITVVTSWIGAFCACFGWTATRRALFPLLFLYLLVPVPEPIMSRIVVALQHASADAADVFYTVAGVPVGRHGQFFILANQQIEIAKECSGIRSSIALLITGLVFGHLFLRKAWSKVLLVTAILPLGIFKNGLRIFTLSVLASYVDPRFLSGPLHYNGGVVFFSIALGMLVLLLLALRRLECLNSQGPPPSLYLTGQDAAHQNS